MHSPSIFVALSAVDVDSEKFATLLKTLRLLLRTAGDEAHADVDLTEQMMGETKVQNPLAQLLLSAAMWLQSGCGVPVTSHGVCIQDGEKLYLLVPVQDCVAPLVQQLVGSLISLSGAALSLENLDDLSFDEVRTNCRQIRAAMQQVPPNTAYLLCAARKMNVPVMAKIANYFLFGQGRRATVLDSSLSATESFFGTAIAKDKIACSVLLRQLGLPVPAQRAVGTFESAKEQASNIGYPVVIKPADLDGGAGVFPGLLSDEDLERAWTLARAQSRNLVIEKHVEGADFRLMVAKGELIAAIERTPAQIVGNGKSTVGELIVEANDSRRRASAGSRYVALPTDSETAAVLASQGLGLDEIPDSEQIVKLRLASNHAQGGTVRWCMDRVHPENVRLAIYVAEVLNLEVAGIDFVTADISRPWRDVPSAIIEVNAQPSMGRPTSHGLFEKLLRKLLPDGGRIPHVAIVGDDDDVLSAIKKLETSLMLRGFTVGSVLPSETFLDQALIGRNDNLYQGHRTVMMHPRVTAVLVAVTNAKDLRFGLASPKFDFIVPATAEPSAIVHHLATNFDGRVVALHQLLGQ